MIGNIAHQWRQPLNALAIKVQDVPIALEVGDLDEKYALEFKNGSMALINYMSGTIDDFRSFFKPDKQKIRFALKNTVEKACVLIKDSLHFSFIELEVLPIDESVYAYGYPNEFSQVLLNILSNAKDALKANTTMGSDKRITVSFALSDGFARLSVSDNAGGIDEAIMDKVFDPYFTTKHQGQGTGLGLYMSKMIVEQNMGGTLTVENRGDGACFTVSLPTSGKAESLQD
jgi:signal transduction histidine kinase